MYINAYYGAKSTSALAGVVGAQHGRRPAQIFRKVVLRAPAADLRRPARVARAVFIVMFATEMINASSGLGHLIRVAESGLRFDLMYVSLVSIAILGYAGDRLLRLARHRVLAWQEQAA